MSHLHIPDGILPLALWLPGQVVAFLVLLLTARASGSDAPFHVAYRGSLGALVLAAMAIQIPLGPFEYHLSLMGPVGILLGGSAAFQIAFIVSAILALVGHGGLTVIGLNALVLGIGAAVARPVYRLVARWRGPGAAMAAGTAAAQALSGGLWLLVVAFALRGGHAVEGAPGRVPVLAAVAIPLWALGIAVESAVAFGIGRFLARVRADLLPASRAKPSESRVA